MTFGIANHKHVEKFGAKFIQLMDREARLFDSFLYLVFRCSTHILRWLCTYLFCGHISRIYISVYNKICMMMNTERRKDFYFEIWVNVEAFPFPSLL